VTDLERAVLGVVTSLSGKRRAWVRCDRVIARIAPGRGSLAIALERPDWKRDPATREYRALISLVERGLVEGIGHFGAPDGAPVDPVFNRCRLASR
jgi:hypothetical protein